MPAYVYILRCSDGTYYTGVCKDPVRRLRQHNGEIKGGARYTTTRRPVVVVYCQQVESWSAALKRERAIKRMARVSKQRLIDGREAA